MVTLNKKMRRIKEAIADKTEQAKSYLDGESKDVDKATALLDEVDELKKEYTAEERLFKHEQQEAQELSDKQFKEKEKSDSTEKFANVVRGMVRKDPAVTAMTEGVNADGGYTVPEDISTEIRHFKEKEFSFENYISVETVNTNQGRRTYQSKASCTGFTEVAEAGAIPAIAAPNYQLVSYTITDKAARKVVRQTEKRHNQQQCSQQAYRRRCSYGN